VAVFDVLISGGYVIDPASGLSGPVDVGIAEERITAIGPELSRQTWTRLIDARGYVVTPGLVDIHVHSYWGVNPWGCDADATCLATGVTTAVDAGSAGSANFPGFRRWIHDLSRTRMLGFVALAQHGIQLVPGELRYLEFADPDGTARTVLEQRPVAVGVKVRLHRPAVGDNGAEALRLAVRAAEGAECPLMVHVGNTGIRLEQILDALRPGDIVTHCYNPQPPTVVDESGRLREAVRIARDRGVGFDLGHAKGCLSFDLARRAIDAGLPPDTISTDLHGRLSAADAVDMPSRMTKVLALGIGLEQVIAASTINPARAIGWDDRIGRLEVGREADIAVLEVIQEPIRLRDSVGAEIVSDRWIAPRWTIRAGKVFPAGRTVHPPSSHLIGGPGRLSGQQPCQSA
jgi:dihydroorotase